MRGAWAGARSVLDIAPGALPAGEYLRHIIGVYVSTVKLIELASLIKNNYHHSDMTAIAAKRSVNAGEKKTGP